MLSLRSKGVLMPNWTGWCLEVLRRTPSLEGPEGNRLKSQLGQLRHLSHVPLPIKLHALYFLNKVVDEPTL